MVTLKITNQIFNQRHEFESEDIGPQKVDLQKGEENSGRQVARMLTIYLFFEFLNFYMSDWHLRLFFAATTVFLNLIPSYFIINALLPNPLLI